MSAQASKAAASQGARKKSVTLHSNDEDACEDCECGGGCGLSLSHYAFTMEMDILRTDFKGNRESSPRAPPHQGSPL